MDVRAAANGRCVAESLGDVANRAHNVFSGLARRSRRREVLQCGRRQNAARPRAKVLRGEVRAGDLAQIGVDVVRANAANLAAFVEVLKELLTGNLLAAADDAREAWIANIDFPHFAALAPEAKTQPRRRDPHVRPSSVVKPYEPLSRAYAKLSMRIRVRSRSSTTVASTFSRDIPGRRRSRRTRRRIFGSAAAKAARRSNLVAPRSAFQRG